MESAGKEPRVYLRLDSDGIVKKKPEIPMLIVVVMEKERLYSNLGIEGTLQLEQIWNQEVQEIMDVVTEKNPISYCMDECLNKVYGLKYRLESMNTKLLIPIPILCIAVIRAEYDYLPDNLNDLLHIYSSRSIGLYFSSLVTKQMNLSEYVHKQLKPISISNNGPPACVLDAREYKTATMENGLLIKDPIVCWMLFPSEEVLSSFTRGLEGTKQKPLTCHYTGIQSFAITIWNNLSFKSIYTSQASCYVTRVSELFLEKAKKGYTMTFFPEVSKILALLKCNKDKLFVHELSVPYCKAIEKYDYVTDGVTRTYNTKKEVLVPCDYSCIMERLKNVEKAVEKT